MRRDGLARAPLRLQRLEGVRVVEVPRFARVREGEAQRDVRVVPAAPDALDGLRRRFPGERRLRDPPEQNRHVHGQDSGDPARAPLELRVAVGSRAAERGEARPQRPVVVPERVIVAPLLHRRVAADLGRLRVLADRPRDVRPQFAADQHPSR